MAKIGQSQITINGIKVKRDKEFGSYYGTTSAESYDVGKHHFKPSFRSIYVSSEMYPRTKKSFFYVTSDIHGKMRLYRHKEWNEADVGNIFASGKTLSEAISKFEHKFKNKIYNVKNGRNPCGTKRHRNPVRKGTKLGPVIGVVALATILYFAMNKQEQ